MTNVTLNKLIDGLKDIVCHSNDVNSRTKVLELLLPIYIKDEEIVKVDLYSIPLSVYEESILFMQKEEKIKTIKCLKDGITIDGQTLGLKEAKLLSERISVIERIPMSKGYEIPAN